MKKILLILVAVIGFGVFSTYAQQSKLKIAVIDLDYGSGSGNAAMSLTSLLTTELVNTKKYVVMERSSVQKIINELKLQNEQKASARAAEIGNLLGVHKIITGECVGNKVSLRLIDVESGGIESAVTIENYYPYYVRYNKRLITYEVPESDYIKDQEKIRRKNNYMQQVYMKWYSEPEEAFAKKLLNALLH